MSEEHSVTATDQGRLAAPDGEVAPADDTWDDAWLEPPAPRSKLRTALVLALAASLCFLGGALVQRQFGSASGGAGQMAGGFPGGDASGGFPGGGQMPSEMPTDGAQTPGGNGQSASGQDQSGEDSSTADDTQQVIGTLTKKSGDTWIVTDLGGTKHTITLSDSTKVQQQKSVSTDDVAQGATVDITTDADGAATSITLR